MGAARLGISERQFSIQKCDILLIPDVVLGAGEAMRRREFIAICRQYGRCMAACGAGAAAEGARDWVSRQQIARCGGEPSDRISPRLEGGRLCRGRKHRNGRL